jgi:hypothetical protein
MGWRITPADEFRCVMCAKRMLERTDFHPLATEGGAARRQASVA